MAATVLMARMARSPGRRGGGSSGTGAGTGTGSGRGRRDLKVHLKAGKGRKTSSRRWLERQLNDPYVAEAKRQGYRSRSAFKLAEIDDRFGFLKPGAAVVDLGAAPGGWSQVAAERVRAAEGHGAVVAIDVRGIEAIPGVTILHKDFYDDDAPDALVAALMASLGRPGADAVLSDMAAHATGHRQTDHFQVMGLAEAALDCARQVLNPGGTFVAKVQRGGTEAQLLAELKRDFASVRHVKPKSSREGSAELYLVATGFRGGGPEG
jgi:23S rRNA (uridine2552-2'-O)-methyltransferase